MSEFIGQSGIGADAYTAARAWLGQFKGGLAMATIGACGLFAAVSGSSLAGTIVMGRTAYPEMKRMGYSDQLASGVTAAGGTLGILIPPSMGFVLIGILANLSIGKLFMAGILPGIVVIIFYLVTIAIMCRINPKAGSRINYYHLERKRSLSCSNLAGCSLVSPHDGWYLRRYIYGNRGGRHWSRRGSDYRPGQEANDWENGLAMFNGYLEDGSHDDYHGGRGLYVQRLPGYYPDSERYRNLDGQLAGTLMGYSRHHRRVLSHRWHVL